MVQRRVRHDVAIDDVIGFVHFFLFFSVFFFFYFDFSLNLIANKFQRNYTIFFNNKLLLLRLHIRVCIEHF